MSSDSSADVLSASSLIKPFSNLMSRKRKEQEQDYAHGLANEFCLLSVDNDDEKKKKRKILREHVIRNYKVEELKRFILNDMDGNYAKLVIQKVLNRSDINQQLNRLNIPIEQVENQDFLNVEERQYLDDDKKEIMVRLVGPRLQMHEQPMVLSRSRDSYVLKLNWNSFVMDNKDDLKEDAKIQLWSFRRNRELCFALVVVERADIVNKLIGELGAVSFILSLSDV